MLYRYYKGKAWNKATQESFNQCTADNRIPAQLVLVEAAGAFGGNWIDSNGMQLLLTLTSGSSDYSSTYQAPGGPPMGYNIVFSYRGQPGGYKNTLSYRGTQEATTDCSVTREQSGG